MTGEQRVITREEAGRPCPYCRFALKPGATATVCPTCHAPHHGDCWEDNGGCAIVGCASGPNYVGAGQPPVSKGAPPDAPITAPLPPSPAGDATASAAGGADKPPRRRRLLIGVALVAVAAIGAAAGAFALRGEPGKEPGDGTSQPPVASVGTGAGTVQAPTTTVETVPDDDESGGTPGNGGSSGGSTNAERRRAIARIMLAHHRAIARGDIRAAWALTSDRYRARKLREPGGYRTWARNQRTVQRSISPEGLRVAIQSFDSRSGVATIRLSGMGWSAPSSPCRSFEGITWAKLDGPNWRYEPGYSISDQRRAKWQPRRDELLGWGC